MTRSALVPSLCTAAAAMTLLLAAPAHADQGFYLGAVGGVSLLRDATATVESIRAYDPDLAQKIVDQMFTFDNLLDLDDKVGLVDVFVHRPGGKRVLASKEGYGFILPETEAIAFRRAGKQVLNGQALVCLPLNAADHLAVIGDNGKLLVFPVDELPEMPRGKGVKLQSYREGALRDAMSFTQAEGAAWTTSDGRTRAWPEWRDWLGKRAGAGKLGRGGASSGAGAGGVGASARTSCTVNPSLPSACPTACMSFAGFVKGASG